MKNQNCFESSFFNVKKFFSLGLSIFLLFALLVGNAFGEFYDDNSGDSWDDAYIIDSAEDWLSFCRYDTSNKYYKLASDIDLSNNQIYSNVFEGYFDGQNHTITISGDEPLFYRMFSDLISFDNMDNMSIIKNLNVDGIISATYNKNYIGGIVGAIFEGSIENCNFKGTIKVSKSDSNDNEGIGGIVGALEGGPVILKNNTFSGTIQLDATTDDLDLYVGGIAGLERGRNDIFGDYSGIIENCKTTSGSKISITNNTINADSEGSGAYTFVGGIIGMTWSDCSHVINCISEASITGASYNGGIVGGTFDAKEDLKLSNNIWPDNLPEIGYYEGSLFVSGDGKSWETAYVIDSPELFKYANRKLIRGVILNSNFSKGKYFKLESDIDLSSEDENYQSGYEFNGCLDGQNHTIKINIINRNNAFFSRFGSDSDGNEFSSIIKNLNVEGTLAPNASFIDYMYYGTLDNCHFKYAIESNAWFSLWTSGGIVRGLGDGGGNEHKAIIRNCSFQGTVKATGGDYFFQRATAGGIAGYVYATGKIENCTVNSGSVIISNYVANPDDNSDNNPDDDEYSRAGGIAGYVETGAIIANCTSNAKIEGNAKYKGGIIGFIREGKRSNSDAVDFFDRSRIYGNHWTGEYPEIGIDSYNPNIEPTSSDNEPNSNDINPISPDNKPSSSDVNPEPVITIEKPVITTTKIPNGKLNTEYTPFQLTATGTTPIQWNALNLPDGITCNSSGLISGTPRKAGNFTNVLISARNSAGTTNKYFSFYIENASTNLGTSPEITDSLTLPAATVGQFYQHQFSATGTNPIKWSATNLPKGFNFSSSGLLSGIPETSGIFNNIFVTAENSSGSSTKIFSLTVNAASVNPNPISQDNSAPEPIDNPELSDDDNIDEQELADKIRTFFNQESNVPVKNFPSENLNMNNQPPSDWDNDLNGEVVAVFPEIQVTDNGIYLFNVSFDKTVKAGSSLIWYSTTENISEKSVSISDTEAKDYVFLDENNNEMTFPIVKDINAIRVAVILEANKKYSPIISAVSENKNNSENNHINSSGGGGGCNSQFGFFKFGIFSLLLVLIFRKSDKIKLIY